MTLKESESTSLDRRKKAEEILKKIREKYEKEREKIDTPEKELQYRASESLKVRARIPVTITPEVKKSLRQITTLEEKEKVNIVLDFKDPKSREGKIRISKLERKNKKKMVSIRPPGAPSSLSSPTSVIREPFNKDILLEKLKRQNNIKKRRKSRK